MKVMNIEKFVRFATASIFLRRRIITIANADTENVETYGVFSLL
jgi:hypothetical protein